MLGLGHIDHSSGNDREQYLGLALAKHFDDGRSLYLMNCAHPSITYVLDFQERQLMTKYEIIVESVAEQMPC